MEVYHRDKQEGQHLMLEKYRDYIWYTINSFYPTFVHDKEDMFQCGAIGLMHAMELYRPELGRFTTYATPHMKKEMGRQARFAVSESSSYYAEIHTAVIKARARLEADGRQASVDAIMEETGLSRKIVMRELKVDHTKIPLDALASKGSYMCLSDSFMADDLLRGIPTVNQMIVRMKAVDGMSFSQISTRIHMSDFHVKRLYRESIAVLRKQG